MNINTLVLSGGSTSCISYVGIFNYLFEKNILAKDLHNITHIVTTSAGILYSILLILRLNIETILTLLDSLHFEDYVQCEKIHINNIINDFGIFTNKLDILVQSILKETIQQPNITLQEFYDLYKVKLTVKVCNVTKRTTEFINHETDPDIQLTTLATMTTSIPIIFKPIKYKDCLYVDGGTHDNYPKEYIDHKNYLGINITSCPVNPKPLPLPLMDYVYSIHCCSSLTTVQDKKRDCIIKIDNSVLSFKLSNEEKQKIIDQGYNQIKSHFESQESQESIETPQ